MADNKPKAIKWYYGSKMLEKLKKIKHIEIYIAVIIALILLLVYFGSKTNNKAKVTTESDAMAQYEQSLESRLSKALSTIEGAGEVAVMITLDGDIEYKYVQNEETKTISNNGTTTSTTTYEPVIVTKNGVSSPITIEQVMPNIKGVIVICNGANNTKVKLNLIKATEVLLGVSAQKIEVFAGN